VDIEEFYDADDRRRQSAEIELGGDWHDAKGVRYELNWIEDTGELYVMREPARPSGPTRSVASMSASTTRPRSTA